MIQGYKITERKRKQNNKADETKSLLHKAICNYWHVRAIRNLWNILSVLGKDSR